MEGKDYMVLPKILAQSDILSCMSPKGKIWSHVTDFDHYNTSLSNYSHISGSLNGGVITFRILHIFAI
jgi:hypothetical protein